MEVEAWKFPMVRAIHMPIVDLRVAKCSDY